MLSSFRKRTQSDRLDSHPPFLLHGSYLAGILVGSILSLPAGAALNDTIHPFVTLASSYDDNLLRLPDVTPGFTDQRFDRSTQLQAGLYFERPVGRQLFSGQAKVSRVSFAHFDQLNYNGKDFSGTWEWHVANHLEGHLGGTYAQTLTSFSDFHTSERNLRTERRQFADGAWRFHPSWRLRASYTQTKFNYDLASQRYNDRNLDTGEVGVDFMAASGSRVGLVARHMKGRYPNHRTVGDVVIDDGFSQDELKANIYWMFGGVTQVQFLGGWVRRNHDFFVLRDTKGLDGRAVAYWKPAPRIKFTIQGWREFTAVENNIVNSAINKGGSLAAAYELTAKISVDASIKHEKRDFSQINGFNFPGDTTDSSRTASAGLTYKVLPSLQVVVSGYHDQRSANIFIGNGAYRANGATLSLTGQF